MITDKIKYEEFDGTLLPELHPKCEAYLGRFPQMPKDLPGEEYAKFIAKLVGIPYESLIHFRFEQVGSYSLDRGAIYLRELKVKLLK
jgi:hypothetical protein